MPAYQEIPGADIDTLTIRFKKVNDASGVAIMRFYHSKDVHVYLNLTDATESNEYVLSRTEDEEGFTILTIDFQKLGGDNSDTWAVEDRTTKSLTKIGIGGSTGGVQHIFDYVAFNKVTRLDLMEAFVKEIEAGVLFSQERIEDMLDKIAIARESVNAFGIDKEVMMTKLQAEYEEFLQGNEANTSFHVLSDVHILDNTESTLNEKFADALVNMEKINPNASALIVAGDFSQNGDDAGYSAFYEMLDEYKPEQVSEVLVALGNHDVRGKDSSIWESEPTDENANWDAAYDLYMKYNGKYIPDEKSRRVGQSVAAASLPRI